MRVLYAQYTFSACLVVLEIIEQKRANALEFFTPCVHSLTCFVVFTNSSFTSGVVFQSQDVNDVVHLLRRDIGCEISGSVGGDYEDFRSSRI
jgi:hypothetical protein